MLAAVARFLGGGALSGSRPFASRFLRLSRLLRFARAASPCTDALLAGAGEDRLFKSDNAPFRRGPLPGGRRGELIFEDGAEDPGAWDAIMAEGGFDEGQIAEVSLKK